jgi:hypothetical protein
VKPTFLMFLVDVIVTLQSQLVLKVHFQINCWTFFHLEGMSNTKFTWTQFVCQLVYLTFVNESSIIVNSLKLCKHKSKHMHGYYKILSFNVWVGINQHIY